MNLFIFSLLPSMLAMWQSDQKTGSMPCCPVWSPEPRAQREGSKKMNYFTSCDPRHDMSGRIFEEILLYADILSRIYSDILSGILSDIYSDDILSDIYSDDILSCILSGTLSDIYAMWHKFWHSIWHIFWQKHLTFNSGILYLTSFLTIYIWHSIWQKHLAWILAVEVRQGTLGMDGRGWGPEGNTWRGWS